jgi:hypothetical protein
MHEIPCAAVLGIFRAQQSQTSTRGSATQARLQLAPGQRVDTVDAIYICKHIYLDSHRAICLIVDIFSINCITCFTGELPFLCICNTIKITFILITMLCVGAGRDVRDIQVCLDVIMLLDLYI